MAIGMTYEQYWFDDPLMVRVFRKADIIRQQRVNDEAWLYGVYVLHALDATVGNMFRKKGSKPSEYPQNPLSIGDEPEKKEEKKKKEESEELEALYAKAYMSNMVLAGKKWKK